MNFPSWYKVDHMMNEQKQKDTDRIQIIQIESSE